jgi:cyclic beta-1,2-glucan synthetase
VESLLGLRLEVDRLRFAPCLPPAWTEFAMRYRYRETYYHIAVRRAQSSDDEELDASAVVVDGVEQEGNSVALVDDRREHRVEIRVGVRRPRPEMSVT